MSRLAERGASACRLAGPPLLPKPQPGLAVFPSPCLSSLSGIQQGRPWLGEAQEGDFSSFHQDPSISCPLGSPLPRCCEYPSAPPRSAETLSGIWMEDAGVAKEGGVVSLGSPLPQGWEAGSDSRGDKLRVEALVLPSVSEKHRQGHVAPTVGEGIADPQTGRVRLQWRTARGGPSGDLGSYSPGIPRPWPRKSPAAPPCSAPAPPPQGQGAARAAGQ